MGLPNTAVIGRYRVISPVRRPGSSPEGRRPINTPGGIQVTRPRASRTDATGGRIFFCAACKYPPRSVRDCPRSSIIPGFRTGCRFLPGCFSLGIIVGDSSMIVRTEPDGLQACRAAQVLIREAGEQGAQDGPQSIRHRVAGPTGFSYARCRTIERLPRPGSLRAGRLFSCRAGKASRWKVSRRP